MRDVYEMPKISLNELRICNIEFISLSHVAYDGMVNVTLRQQSIIKLTEVITYVLKRVVFGWPMGLADFPFTNACVAYEVHMLL